MSFTGAIHALQPVSLEQLSNEASLQTRTDRKYLVPIAALDTLMAALPRDAQALEIGGDRSFSYQSVYFDTADRRSYFDAAHKRRSRFKVRTRTYLDSGLCFFEIKTRNQRGQVVKDRCDYEAGSASTINEAAIEFLQSKPATAPYARALGPTLTNRYDRTTFLLPSGSARVTIDTDLIAWDRHNTLISWADFAIIETKTSGGPSTVDRLLWSQGIRPQKISKFALAQAALDPRLPANKWTRTLRSVAPDAARERASASVTPYREWAAAS